MDINYTSYPFLIDIENGTLDNFKMCHCDDEYGYTLVKNLLEKMWSYSSERVRQNVCVACKTYLEAIEKSAGCFDRLIDSAVGDLDNRVTAADYANPQEVHPLTEKEQIAEEELYKLYGNAYGCYLLGPNQMLVYGNSLEPTRHMFCFEMIDGLVTRAIVQYGEDYAYFVTKHPTVAKIFRDGISNYAIEVIAQMQHEQEMLVMFERYAKIETRFMPPKTKNRIEPKDFHASLNSTRIKVNIRDSRYFTTIIRNNGFKVSGHLRLQRYKDENGVWTRKLIYIDEFMKHGYHRQATIAK